MSGAGKGHRLSLPSDPRSYESGWNCPDIWLIVPWLSHPYPILSLSPYDLRGPEAPEDVLHGRWEDVGRCCGHPWHHVNPAIGAGNIRLWHRSLVVESWPWRHQLPRPWIRWVISHGSYDELKKYGTTIFGKMLCAMIRWYCCTSWRDEWIAWNQKHHVNASMWKDSQWLKPAPTPKSWEFLPKSATILKY